ncbi:hypothetical protein QFZ48_003769 [Chitinophaga sp. W2I13]|uniref:glycoside hydrolase family 2 protein n=1 Tax=Chitinophaga sp. W2I13 TaxID=3373923 RepID=UPI003D19D45C
MKIKHKLLILFLLVSGHALCKNQHDTLINNKSDYKISPIHLLSRWAKDVNPKNALKEYPRPQMQRNNWENLNGLWEYTITDSITEIPVTYDGQILVPYPIESALSGVKKMLLPTQRLWYRRTINITHPDGDSRLILNFGAIDWQAQIFINRNKVAEHSGGYQQFSVDITDYIKSGENELLIKVYDPTDQGPNPHGKQVLNPMNIYYTPSSGIWQTVWLEKVPHSYISRIKTTPDIDNKRLEIAINIANNHSGGNIEVVATANGRAISEKRLQYANNSKQIITHLTIPDEHLWSPDDPFLYDLSIKLINNDKTIDQVKSYFGMRKIDIQKDEKGADRIFLNNKYTFNLGVLDQGYWPEGGYTAPTDEALAFDIKAIKSMGFNTIRKHIKIEPERWYYHADKIGVLVWQDFVNPPQHLPSGSKAIFEKEVRETMAQLHNHPCIITWVIFNERWGAYDQQRITEWVKKNDPSRIVNGHSGELLYVNDQLRAPSDSPWIGSDVTDVHSYSEPRNTPGQPGKAKVIGEFGGIGVPVPFHQWDDVEGWGYTQVTPAELKGKYESMSYSVKKFELAGLSASIYTQPFDVEGEENGILTYDREVIKIPINELRKINMNLVPQTRGFMIDPSFKIAMNSNINDNDSRYQELLKQYENGLKDSTFLRRLTLMAIRQKDQLRATQIGNDYINTLLEPFSKENLIFIGKITRTTKDRGFELFNAYPERINSILGQVSAEYTVKMIIEHEELAPYFSHNSIPAWDSLQSQMNSKYGVLGEEVILGKRMMYCAEATQDWKAYGKYYVLYFQKAMKHPDYITNNLSWKVFQHVDDSDVLEFALKVMKYDLETWDQNEPQAYDTYANLLHKLNKSSEAIKWEEKAIQLKRNEAEEKVFAETLQKMKAGLPTWPQNN